MATRAAYLSPSEAQILMEAYEELKAKGGTSNGKAEAAEELKKEFFNAEDKHPGICDSLVAELLQRLQRFSGLHAAAAL